jgi:hypothetical protein
MFFSSVDPALRRLILQVGPLRPTPTPTYCLLLALWNFMELTTTLRQ